MNSEMLNIGYSCYVSSDKVVTVASPESSPIKRLIQEARDRSALIDCTYGKKTKAVIVTTSDHVILSARTAEYILNISEKEDEDE